MDGILIVDKPVGPTSADIVRNIKRIFRAKVGHLGTLDPFASGVLPICLNEGTKLAQFLNVADKAYEGTIQLGVRTDTGDLTGHSVEDAPLPPTVPEAAALAEIASTFLGDRLQVPPMYSAIKKAGTPLYKLARAGVSVEREPRPIRIDRLLLAMRERDVVHFVVDCSKGTYVRVLAEEISGALGTVGHLSSLRRTRFGHFRIEQAITAAGIDPTTAAAALLSLRDSLVDVREVVVDDAGVQRIRCGDAYVLSRLRLGASGSAVKLISQLGQLVAVVQPNESGAWSYARVFEMTPPTEAGSPRAATVEQ